MSGMLAKIASALGVAVVPPGAHLADPPDRPDQGADCQTTRRSCSPLRGCLPRSSHRQRIGKQRCRRAPRHRRRSSASMRVARQRLGPCGTATLGGARRWRAWHRASTKCEHGPWTPQATRSRSQGRNQSRGATRSKRSASPSGSQALAAVIHEQPTYARPFAAKRAGVGHCLYKCQVYHFAFVIDCRKLGTSRA